MKKNEIEKQLAKDLDGYSIDMQEDREYVAKELVEKGYGKINKAVREFVEDLELSISLLRHADCDPPMYIRGFEDCQKRIKELLINKIKEFFTNE